MDDPLQKAISELDRAIRFREVELEAMRKTRAQLAGQTDKPVEPLSNEWEGMGITEASFKFLTEVGEPRGTREIADAIRSRGVRTTSHNYTATVYATLANAKSKFDRKDGLWTVKHAKKK